MLFILLLEPRGERHGADHGDDAAGVVAGGRQHHGDAEQVADVDAGAGEKRGIDHRKADQQAFHLGQLEALGRRIAEDRRQEVERGIREGVQDVVGAALAVQRAERREQRENTLEDTAGAEHAEERGEHAGDDADEGVEGFLLLLRAFLVVHLRGEAFEVPHRNDGRIDVRDMVADDDLILAAGLHHSHDAVGRLQDVRVRLGLVLEVEPEPGDAVGDRGDVVFPAYVLQDDAGKTVVLTCH